MPSPRREQCLTPRRPVSSLPGRRNSLKMEAFLQETSQICFCSDAPLPSTLSPQEPSAKSLSVSLTPRAPVALTSWHLCGLSHGNTGGDGTWLPRQIMKPLQLPPWSLWKQLQLPGHGGSSHPVDRNDLSSHVRGPETPSPSQACRCRKPHKRPRAQTGSCSQIPIRGSHETKEMVMSF